MVTHHQGRMTEHERKVFQKKQDSNQEANPMHPRKLVTGPVNQLREDPDLAKIEKEWKLVEAPTQPTHSL